MAQKLSEAKAMEEYNPISSVVQKTSQLNELKAFLDMLIPLDQKREQLGRELRGSNNTWDTLKTNIVLLTNTANFRYGNYAFKATYEVAKPKTDIDIFLENLKTALFNEIDEEDFEAIFSRENVTIKLAYLYLASKYGIDEDIVETAWDNATPRVPKSEEYREAKMSVYKFRESVGEDEPEAKPVPAPTPKSASTPAPKSAPASKSAPAPKPAPKPALSMIRRPGMPRPR